MAAVRSRRNFLKLIGLGAVATALPLPELAAPVPAAAPAAAGTYTGTLLMQSSIDLEALIYADMLQQVAADLDRKMFNGDTDH